MKDDDNYSPQPGITVIKGFKTSDGQIFEDFHRANEHEAMNMLIKTLRRNADLGDGTVDLILDNKEYLYEALKTYLDRVAK